MKILITSGGTTEPIDHVRGITNHATGQLGAIIAEQFLAKGHAVTLITTKTAVKPKEHPLLTLIVIQTVKDLLEVMKVQVPLHDVLIHSMAVSDYTPVYMTDLTEVENTPKLTDLLTKENTEKKVSSQSDYQVLFLKKTPKIISLVKTWNPNIFLVGFKLLVDVPKTHLFEVARASLSSNHADLIVANDLTQISGKEHVAYLIDANSETKVNSKSAIAAALYERITHE